MKSEERSGCLEPVDVRLTSQMTTIHASEGVFELSTVIMTMTVGRPSQNTRWNEFLKPHRGM